jgi:hypothetical protein
VLGEVAVDRRTGTDRRDQLDRRLASAPGLLPELARHTVLRGKSVVYFRHSEGGEERRKRGGLSGHQSDVVDAKHHHPRIPSAVRCEPC